MYQDWMENIPVIGDIEIKGGKAMTDEDIKAIRMLEFIVNHNSLLGYKPENRQALAEYILNLIEKQDKIIKGQSYTNKKMRKKLNGYKRLFKLKVRQLEKRDKEIERLKEYEYMYKDLCD